MGALLAAASAHTLTALHDLLAILRAPRTYARVGRLFDPARIDDALLFLWVTLMAALALMGLRLLHEPHALTSVATNLAWKLVLVLIESVVITGVWRALGTAGTFVHYFVATCFYLGAGLFVQQAALFTEVVARHSELVAALHLPRLIGGVLLLWAVGSWRAYGDFSNAGWGRTIWALLLCGGVSLPILVAGARTRDQLFTKVIQRTEQSLAR